jgi:hypothetical protein
LTLKNDFAIIDYKQTIQLFKKELNFIQFRNKESENNNVQDDVVTIKINEGEK